MDGGSAKKWASLDEVPSTTLRSISSIPMSKARNTGNHPNRFHLLPLAIAPAARPRKELSSMRLA